MNPPTEPTERPETVEPGPRHGRGRSFAKRLGAVLGPLFLFVGLPVALRALFGTSPA